MMSLTKYLGISKLKMIYQHSILLVYISLRCRFFLRTTYTKSVFLDENPYATLKTYPMHYIKNWIVLKHVYVWEKIFFLCVTPMNYLKMYVHIRELRNNCVSRVLYHIVYD